MVGSELLPAPTPTQAEGDELPSDYPMTDESATKECPYCDGSGGIPHTVMVCCGYPNPDGSCCGNGKLEIEFEQCQWCAENQKPNS